MTQRRLASQDREDSVNSRRDYQQIQVAHGVRFSGSPTLQTIVFSAEIGFSERGLAGIGGYIYPSRECSLTVSAATQAFTFHLQPTWNRVGFAFPWLYPAPIDVRLNFSPGLEYFEVWGFDGGPIELPPQVAQVTAFELSKPHLAPETFFLPHSSPITYPVAGPLSDPYEAINGLHPIALKKCSYFRPW